MVPAPIYTAGMPTFLLATVPNGDLDAILLYPLRRRLLSAGHYLRSAGDSVYCSATRAVGHREDADVALLLRPYP